MENEIVIRACGLGKTFKLYDKPSDRLREALNPFRRRYSRDFDALRNINFQIQRGDTVGIIGLNGSGKSTLLQLLCGVLYPTTGSVSVQGRIAALLELGAGFNPNFSGRENVYLYGTLIGLTKDEIDRRFADIVQFAEIGGFLDQPVKSYSSGMYVRLAFSVAINVDPDILIIDEALAVGDMLFQAKCMVHLKRMMEKGVTVLFVSHDINAVRMLCTKCLYLERGDLVEFGDSANVIRTYMGRMQMDVNDQLKSLEGACSVSQLKARSQVVNPSDFKPSANNFNSRISNDAIRVCITEEKSFSSSQSRFGSFGARILDACLINSHGEVADSLELHESFRVQFSVRFLRNMENYAVGCSIFDVKGIPLVGAMTSSYPEFSPRPAKAGDVIVFEAAGSNVFTQGVYTVELAVEIPVFTNEQHISEDVVQQAIVFKSVFPPNKTRWFPTRVWVPVEYKNVAHIRADEF